METGIAEGVPDRRKGKDAALTRRRAMQLRPPERRAQLLACAVRAFALHGLGNARHAQVARIADVSVPTVFAYFPTREALVGAVLAEVERAMMAIIRRDESDAHLGAFDRILNILIGYADAFTKSPDLIRIFLTWSGTYQGLEGHLFREYNGRVRDIFSSLIRDGVRNGDLPAGLDEKYSVLIILGATSIIAQMKYWDSSDEEIETYLRGLLHAALGVGKGP